MRPSHAIFCVVDSGYLRYLLPLLRSLDANYPSHPELLVYWQGLTSAERRLVQSSTRNVTLRPVPADYLEGRRLAPAISPLVFLRFALWTSEFDDYETILHLDADCLVLRPLDYFFDLDRFLMMECRGAAFGDICAVFNRRVSEANFATLDLLRADKLDFPRQMGCADVFFLPRRLRTPQQHELLWYLHDRYRNYLQYADQSVLTLWMMKNEIPFYEEKVFNFQPHFVRAPDITASAADAYVLSFSSARKPDTVEFDRWELIGDLRPVIKRRFAEYGGVIPEYRGLTVATTYSLSDLARMAHADAASRRAGIDASLREQARRVRRELVRLWGSAAPFYRRLAFCAIYLLLIAAFSVSGRFKYFGAGRFFRVFRAARRVGK